MPAQLSNQDFKLKYLFKAIFVDGSTFEQPVDDHSEIDPSRSSFYDVLQNDKKVLEFGLYGDDQSFEVNLLHGYFEVNGVRLYPGEIPPHANIMDLIFYREHQQDMNITYSDNGNKSEPGEHRCKYFIGWQYNLNGKNYSYKLGIS